LIILLLEALGSRLGYIALGLGLGLGLGYIALSSQFLAF